MESLFDDEEKLVELLNGVSVLGPFGKVVALRKLLGGFSNQSYRMDTSKGSYVIRFYLEEKTLEQLTAEYELLLLLSKNELAVPKFMELEGVSSKFYFELEDFYVALFPFLAGEHLLVKERELWQVSSIAEFMGKLHRITPPLSVPSFMNFDIQDVLQERIYDKLSLHLPRLQNYDRELADWLQNLAKTITFEDAAEEKQFLDTSLLPQAFIHSDLHEENVLFLRENKQLSAVVDWEECFWGPCLYDIAQSLECWCVKNGEWNFEYAKQFLLIYEHSRGFPLTTLEKKLIYKYFYLTCLIQLCFMIGKEEDYELLISKYARAYFNELICVEPFFLQLQAFFDNRINQDSNTWQDTFT